MTLYKEIMKTMNKLYRNKITDLCIEDVKMLWADNYCDGMKLVRDAFDFLGIEYIKVADLWNVKVRYFTREEQNRVKSFCEFSDWLDDVRYSL